MKRAWLTFAIVMALVALGIGPLSDLPAEASATASVSASYRKPQPLAMLASFAKHQPFEAVSKRFDKARLASHLSPDRTFDSVVYFKVTTSKGGSGAFFPANQTSREAIRGLKAFTEKETGGTPMVTGVVFDRAIPGNVSDQIDSWIRKREQIVATKDASKAKNDPSASPRSAESLHYWQPIQGITQMVDTSGGPPGSYGREFRTELSWLDRDGLNEYNDLSQQKVFEYATKLINSSIGPDTMLRGEDCQGGYNSDFWAARTNFPNPVRLSTGQAQYYMSTFPASANFYPDISDYEDPCNTIDFSWGIGYPQFLDVGQNYYVTVATDAGTTAGNPYLLGVKRLDNDCGLGKEIFSSCISLPPSSGNEYNQQITNQHPGAVPPECVGYELDLSQSPTAPPGTFMYGQPDRWAQGTWRYGDPDDQIEDYCGGG